MNNLIENVIIRFVPKWYNDILCLKIKCIYLKTSLNDTIK